MPKHEDLKVRKAGSSQGHFLTFPLKGMLEKLTKITSSNENYVYIRELSPSHKERKNDDSNSSVRFSNSYANSHNFYFPIS